ncbi:unnamed protein product [Arabis nemorensis]|uniref:HECT-type E3 ubiquitin transferase n=1 Tax=Arabis nemorensis TaxID=586526 RepID=A0A565C6K8_9BRAS|nr:unnamed protein product [Arabis nemorensis]
MTSSEFEEGDIALSFALAIEDDLKKRTEILLCENGNNLDVTFENRERSSAHFVQGFEDMISVPHNVFFNTMKFEDLDALLRGKENICIDEWKAYMEYDNFEENETLIKWFWKRRQNLLFFWRAKKYLPVEGFKGFPSRLRISRVYKDDDNAFPESATCLLELYLPQYTSFDKMEYQVMYVTERAISTGFGLL